MRRHTQAQRELSTGFQQILQQPQARSAVCEPAAVRYNDGLVLDDLTPSDELISAVTAERERLDQVVIVLDEAHGRLKAELATVVDQLADVAQRREQLARFLGEEPSDHDPRPVAAQTISDAATRPSDGSLRGAAIREAAVRAALGQDRPEQPRHYREWLTLIEAARQSIHGQDSAATLLTQLSRCPLIARAIEPGTYRLERDALVRLRQQRDALHAEAGAQVARTNDREYDVIDLAQALAAVEARVRRIDRAIQEAADLVDRLDAHWFFTDPDQPQNSVEPQTAVAA
jgi:hypothetical protein